MALQPLDPPAVNAGLPRPLVPLWRHHQRANHAAVCRQSFAMWQQWTRQGAKLFYGPDRRKADTAAIEQFLDRLVRGSQALLSIGAEGFVAVPPWRNLAVASCVRAGDGKTAALFAAGAAAEHDGAPRMALAVALAVQQRRWEAAAATVATAHDPVRVPLWQALLHPATAATAIARARQAMQTVQERDLIDAVARHTGVP